MELSEFERASARPVSVPEFDDTFRRLSGSIDAAERAAGERIGGPTNAELIAIRRMEAELPPPATSEAWRWLCGRLARAIENEWSDDFAGPILALAK